jgi:predicted TIM-barrel fold metal-dependent hydrolase
MKPDRPDLDLLRGAIDMHAHTHPALFRRPIDDADLARIARDYGMRGFVLKDHDSMTTGRAYYIRQMFDGIEAFGAIVLNRSVGGVDPYVVQAAIHYGARVIWMPSNHSRWHAEYFKTADYPQLGRARPQLSGAGVTILDDAGGLKPEIFTILDMIAEADVCLATGHLSPAETRLLLEEAVRRGVRRVLVTHANWALTKYSLEEQKELIRKGAYLEYVTVSCVSPIFFEQQPAELATWIKELQGDRLILSSDLGQFSGPPHPEGMRMLVATLLDLGVPFEYLEKMTKRNPALLLGLEP